VAERSKARVCGRSLAGIVDSNPAVGMNVCLLCVLCVFSYRSLGQADHSSRGVLPAAVCHFVLSRNLKNEVALVRAGLLRQRRRRKKKKKKKKKLIFKSNRIEDPITKD
jgi:hypothetical protein